MSSKIKKQLEEIEQLFIHGNFDQAMERVDKTLEAKDIDNIDRLTLLVQKNEIIFHQGKLDESLKLSEEIFSESKKQNLLLLQLDSIILKGWVFSCQGEMKKSLEGIEKGEEIIEKLESLAVNEYAKRKAHLLFLKALHFGGIVDFKTAEEYMLKSLEFIELTKNKFLISIFMSYTCSILEKTNNLKKAKELSKKSLSLAKEINNKTAISMALWSNARVPLMENRDYKKVKDFFQQALELAEELRNDLFISGFSHDLAVAYAFLFDYENALKYYLKALPNSNKGLRIYLYHNIHNIYRRMGENEQAIKYLKNRLNITQEMNIIKFQSGTLLNLVTIYIDIKDTNKAQEYLELLNQLKEQNQEEKSILLNYQFAKGYFLKSSDRMKDWITALEIFKGLLNEDEENISIWTKLSLLLHTSEILYKELQATGNEDLLKEIKQNIEEVVSISKKKDYVFLKLNALNLKAQIALIELKPEKANEILLQAIRLAKDKKQLAIEEELKKELKKIEDRFDFWKNLVAKKQPLTETVKQISLENTIRRITHNTDIEIRDEKTGEVIQYRRLFDIKL